MSIAVQRWLPLQQILGVDLEYDQDAQDGADEADQHWQNHNEPEGSPRAVGQMSEVRAVVLRVELVHRVGVRLEQTGADDVLLMVRVTRAGRDGRLQRGLGRRRRPFRFASGEAETTFVVRCAVFLPIVELPVELVHAPLVVVVVLEVPDRWPAMFPQVVLIIRMQSLETARRQLADAVVVDA